MRPSKAHHEAAQRIYDRLGRGSVADIDAIAQALAEAERGERERIVSFITEQAAAMAEMAIHGLPENSRNREAMEAALTQLAHIIRAAVIEAES